ncbi:MAG: hypothetical protein R3F56_00350 [Planctomycetota bacterium]
MVTHAHPARAAAAAATSLVVLAGFGRAQDALAEAGPGSLLRSFAHAAAHAVVAHLAAAKSVACLPLACFDPLQPQRTVTALGVAAANQIAHALPECGFSGLALDTVGVDLRLEEGNVGRLALGSAGAVAAQGLRLGVDVVVFGSITVRRHVPRRGLHRLVLEVDAYSFPLGCIIAHATTEIASDDPLAREVWLLQREDSRWVVADAWTDAVPETSLDAEIHTAAETVARRVVPLVTCLAEKRVIYIPPAETDRFVRQVAELRAAQATLASEEKRRAGGDSAGAASAGDGPLTLDGLEFPSLPDARAHLARQRELLLASDVAQFSMAMSSTLAEVLQPKIAGHEIRVNDLGFTRWSDARLIEDELHTGGLVRSKLARRAMLEDGIHLVVAPRLERWGAGFVLRVEVYDLAREHLAASVHAQIAPRYSPALQRRLEPTPAGAPSDLSDPSPRSERGRVPEQSYPFTR